MKLIGYLRLSKDENGNGLSFHVQRTHIQRYAEATDHDIVEWLEDVASGRDMDRPGIRTALAMLAAGQADGLAVAKLDRLSRSVTDFGLLLETATKQGWSFIAIDLGVDTSTPSGELVVNVLMAIARWERRAIGEAHERRPPAEEAKRTASRPTGPTAGQHPTDDPPLPGQGVDLSGDRRPAQPQAHPDRHRNGTLVGPASAEGL
jgi:DNA invertase Pin-like site-specific DNA recombinase